MELMDAVRARHSVRAYTSKAIEGETAAALSSVISSCNAEGGLSFRLFLDEPVAFGGFMAKYGSFKNVKNYIAVVGKKGGGLDEKCGYYGEKAVLEAQRLGLNSCWVALSYSKGKCPVKLLDGEKFICVIALGYGENQGVQHRNKPMETLCAYEGEVPDWFLKGMEAAMLAPTAMNQQKFFISLRGNKVSIRAKAGFYAKLDMGIVKYHFEIGAAGGDWEWAD